MIDCCLKSNEQCFSCIMAKTSYIWWDDDDVRIVGFYSASSLKQQSACGHVPQIWHISLIPSQPVFALSAACVAEKQQIPILLSLIWPRSTTFEVNTNHYTTDVVLLLLDVVCLEEKQQIPNLVFGLTRPCLEPRIYHTWGEHANHFTQKQCGYSFNDSKILSQIIFIVASSTKNGRLSYLLNILEDEQV